MITQQQYDELKAERDALAAQLTDLIMAIAANYEFEITQGKPSKLAQEYLAEIRAEAVDDVWKKLHHRWKLDTHGDSAFVRVSEIKEMANTIRQGAE